MRCCHSVRCTTLNSLVSSRKCTQTVISCFQFLLWLHSLWDLINMCIVLKIQDWLNSLVAFLLSAKEWDYGNITTSFAVAIMRSLLGLRFSLHGLYFLCLVLFLTVIVAGIPPSSGQLQEPEKCRRKLSRKMKRLIKQTPIIVHGKPEIKEDWCNLETRIFVMEQLKPDPDKEPIGHTVTLSYDKCSPSNQGKNSSSATRPVPFPSTPPVRYNLESWNHYFFLLHSVSNSTFRVFEHKCNSNWFIPDSAHQGETTF